MELKELLKTDSEELTSWVEYRDGIQFQIRYVPRTKLQNISKRCQIWKYDEKTKTRVLSVDGETLTQEYCKASVVGWKGVTPRTLSRLVPANVDKLTEEQLDAEIAFSMDNLLVLVKQAYELDSFLQDASTDLRYFKPNQDEEVKNS